MGPSRRFRSSGRDELAGLSYDPETHIAYVPSFISLPPVALMPSPSRGFPADYVEGFADTGVPYVSGPAKM